MCFLVNFFVQELRASVTAAVGKSVVGARPPGIAKFGAVTAATAADSAVAETVDEARAPLVAKYSASTAAGTVDEVRRLEIATFSAGGDGTEGSRVGVCGSPWSSVGGTTSTAEVAACAKSVADARLPGGGKDKAMTAPSAVVPCRREGLLVWDVRCGDSCDRSVRCECSRSCVRRFLSG